MRESTLAFLIGWLAMTLLTASPTSAATDAKLELRSCNQLIEDFRGTLPGPSKSEADLADCGSVAAAATTAAGRYPFWMGCLNYSEMPTSAHIARCVMLSLKVRPSTKALSDLTGCDEIIGVYEEALFSSTENDAAPAGYQRPSCEAAAEAMLIWSGSRAEWMRCRGYDREIEQIHVATCLLDSPKLKQLQSGNDCKAVRALYEELLVDAYGRLPRDYRTLKCSSARTVISELKKQREIQARKRAKLAREAAARARAREERSGFKIDISKLVYAYLALEQFGRQYVGALRDQAAPVIAAVEGRGREAATRIRDEGVEILDFTDVPDSIPRSDEDLFLGPGATGSGVRVMDQPEEKDTVDLSIQ